YRKRPRMRYPRIPVRPEAPSRDPILHIMPTLRVTSWHLRAIRPAIPPVLLSSSTARRTHPAGGRRVDKFTLDLTIFRHIKWGGASCADFSADAMIRLRRLRFRV